MRRLAIISALVLSAGVCRAAFLPMIAPLNLTNRHPVTQSVPLAWIDSTDPMRFSYNLYIGGSSGNYTNCVGPIFTNWFTYTWTNPPYGSTFYFAVTEVDVNGMESGPSNEISWTMPLPRTNIVLTVSNATQISSDLRNWATNSENPFIRTNAPGPFFFRNPSVKPSISVTHF